MLTTWWEEGRLQDVWHPVEAERCRDVLPHAAAINQLWIKFEDFTLCFNFTFIRFLEASFLTFISCNLKNANLLCKFFSLNILEDLSFGSLKLFDGNWDEPCILGLG